MNLPSFFNLFFSWFSRIKLSNTAFTWVCVRENLAATELISHPLTKCQYKALFWSDWEMPSRALDIRTVFQYSKLLLEEWKIFDCFGGKELGQFTEYQWWELIYNSIFLKKSDVFLIPCMAVRNPSNILWIWIMCTITTSTGA